MVSKIKTLVMGGLVAGSLALSAVLCLPGITGIGLSSNTAGIAERISEATIEI